MLLPRTTRRREKYNLYYNVGNTASLKDANESDIYMQVYTGNCLRLSVGGQHVPVAASY